MRKLASLAAFAAAVLLAAPVERASAATITFSNTQCSSYSITDLGGGAFAVTCNMPSVPVCTISASPATPVVGGSVTLTANCSDAPFGWIWSGTSASCGTSSAVCTDSQSSAGTRTYTVLAGNGTGRGPTASINVNWSAPTNPPTGCTVTRTTPASGNLPTAGGGITLNAACTGGSAPTSWEWRKNGVQTAQSGATYQETLPANANAAVQTYSYDARACVGGSCSGWTAPPTTVTVAGTAPVGLCSQYSDVRFGDIAWSSVSQLPTGTNGGLNPGTLYVVRFTVGAGATSPTDAPGTIEGVEWPDAPAERVTTLSTQPCDFRGWSPGGYFPQNDPSGSNSPLAWTGGNAPALSFLLAGDPPGLFNMPLLTPGQTYYLNVQTIRASDGQNSCTSSTCNMKFTLRVPR